MATTQRIDDLLLILQSRGYWTPEETIEVKEIAMGRDAGFIPEGCEDWMAEDGVPRAYDKVRGSAHLTPEGPETLGKLFPSRLDNPINSTDTPFHPSKSEIPDIDDRLKTIEATLTDLVRRMKALEERVIDPSA